MKDFFNVSQWREEDKPEMLDPVLVGYWLSKRARPQWLTVPVAVADAVAVLRGRPAETVLGSVAVGGNPGRCSS